VIAALTMTSEREEVIDFIAPYFEQTGISIGDGHIKVLTDLLFHKKNGEVTLRYGRCQIYLING